MPHSASTDPTTLQHPSKRPRTPRVSRPGGVCISAAAVAACVALWAGAADAQPLACDDPAALSQTADTLRQNLQRCQNNASYLARMGHLYVQEQRYTEAADHLERALLFDPENPETQLDYALALAGSGDTASALNLVFALERRTDLPAPLRQSLRQVGQQWTLAASGNPGKGPTQVTRISAGLRTGYDSNLLGAPQLSSLTLTLPGENITLPVDGNSQPRPGLYARTDLRLEHTRLQPGGHRWDLQAAVLQRNSPRVTDASSTQAEVQLEHTLSPLQPGDWGHYTSAALTALQTHAGTRYSSQGVAGGWEWAFTGANAAATQQPCTMRMGMEWQNRQLQSNAVLSGRYTGFSGQWGCNLYGGQQWQLSARAGRDQPANPARPGGAQDQYSLRAYVRTPVGPQGAWLIDAEASHSRDAAGYSPLLDNGRRRSIARLTWRAEYQHTLAPGLLALGGIEGVVQNASLPLFTQRSRGVYAGLRASW